MKNSIIILSGLGLALMTSSGCYRSVKKEVVREEPQKNVVIEHRHPESVTTTETQINEPGYETERTTTRRTVRTF